MNQSRRFLTWSWLALALAGAASAQISADPSAPANQRPTILTAPNGVPLVNIQTPSAAGVSRNSYRQFDVQPSGAILNNSRVNASTQLGGWVAANPWLATGPARVILNEVNSSNPSLLRGFVEVAGTQAQVIIANPSGITCSGCGFLNASRASLTTGVPIMNGASLDGLRVAGGSVSIDGAGLNASSTDYTDIITRALQLNAGIWAKQLKVITGATQVNLASTDGEPSAANSSPSTNPNPNPNPPSFAIDSSQLGGMYANKITLLATEVGVGVRNAGDIYAGVGNVIINANGELQNAGHIKAQGQTQINTQADLNNSAIIYAHGNTSITTRGNINNHGNQAIIAANGNTTLNATGADSRITNAALLASGLQTNGQLGNSGNLTASATNIENQANANITAHNLNLHASQQLNNQGALTAGNALEASAANINNQAKATIQASQIKLDAANTLNNRGQVSASQSAYLTAQNLNNLGAGQIYADHIAIGATNLTNAPENTAAAVIAARNRLDIGATNINNLEHAMLFSSGSTHIGGALDANHQATGQASTLNNTSASIEALGNLTINAKSINNIDSHFATTVVQLPDEQITEYQGAGSPNRYAPGTPGVETFRNESIHLRTPERNYDAWNYYNYTRRQTETRIKTSDPAKIISSGTINITADTLTNDKSHIIAGGTLSGNIGKLNNIEVLGEHITTDVGSVTHYWREKHKGGAIIGQDDTTGSSTTTYTPAPTIKSIKLTPTVYQSDSANTKQSSITIPTSTPITAPNNSLFQLKTSPNPSANYLVETNPAFANYRNWLGSDYLLSALSVDPNHTQKRLGDGFYEQRLIRNQVAQLTGRRFLSNHSNDEAQYRSLMNNAISFAKSHQLIPGVALTPEQMAQLTSDIIWLVEQDVTLPDGTSTKALVPKLYVRTQAGDLQPGGALLAGNNVQLNIEGDLLNGGAIAGRWAVLLNANNINNLGRIQADATKLTARNDLNNTGGAISAHSSLVASAGRDLNVSTTTQSQSSAQGSRTNIDRIAGLYVTGTSTSSTLQVSAARNLNLIGAAVQNHGSGSSNISAGNNINLATISTSQSQHIVWDSANQRHEATRGELGSQIQTQGDLNLQADSDINTRGAQLSSQGSLQLQAGRNVNISAARNQTQLDEAHQHSSSFLSSTTTTTRDSLNQTINQATTLSGQRVNIQSGHDVNINASNVVSDQGTDIRAQNNLSITAASNQTTEHHYRQERKSGLMSSGGIGFSFGTRQQSSNQASTDQSAAASTIGATQGSINLQAGSQYQQTGSDVLAPQGGINIQAKTVTIKEAREHSQNQIEQKFKQSGLTLSISNPVISALQTANQMHQAAKDTADPRMKLLAAGASIMAANQAAKAVQAKPSQAGGIRVSLSLGSASSQGQTTQSSNTARGSNLQASRDITISASGNQQSSDITIQGSKVQANNNIQLKADHDVNLQAAANTASQHSTNKSTSSSVSISYGTGGWGGSIAGSKGRGNADGSDTTWSNTHVEAGHQLNIQANNDVNLKGAVASADQVSVKAKNNLNVESLQDSSTFDSKQQNIAASIGVGGEAGANLNFGKSKINSNYQSVTEQSAIQARDGGFNVQVGNTTKLKGGAITSSQVAIDNHKNQFSSNTTTISDIQNQASYQASSISASLSSNPGSSVGIGGDSNQASSTTQSAISGIAGNKAARTGDAQTGIAKIFDANQVQQEINAQTQITKEFGAQASRAIGDYANQKIADLKNEQIKEVSKANPNIEKLQALQLEQQKWEEGGSYRIALHATTGALTGGVPGAAGAATAAAAAPMLNDWQDQVSQHLQNAGLNPSIAQTTAKLITTAAATGVSAAAGGNGAAAAAGFNVDVNNRQLHPTEEQWIRAKAKDFAKQKGISEKQALERLTQQALKNLDLLWRAQLSDGDDFDAKAFLANNQQTFVNDLGEQQKLFTTTGQQVFRPELFADTADPQFYRQFAHSGISRSFGTGLPKEFKDLGIAAKDGLISLVQTAKDHPLRVFKEIPKAVAGLPGAAKDSFIETGHAIGEGSATLFNEDIRNRLNAIYGTDVSGYQASLLLARGTLSVVGAGNAAKLATFSGEKIAAGVGRLLPKNLVKLENGAEILKNGVTPVNTAAVKAADEIDTVAAAKANNAAENTALYPKLKDDLAQQNLNNIAKQDPRLAAVVKGDNGKLNFGIGSGTKEEADRLGRIWVGDGARPVANQKSCPGCLISADGLRIYRPPSNKPNTPIHLNPTGIQANFIKQKDGNIISNGHMSIEK